MRNLYENFTHHLTILVLVGLFKKMELTVSAKKLDFIALSHQDLHQHQIIQGVKSVTEEKEK